MKKTYLILLICMLLPIQERIGATRYASHVDSINLTCDRAQLEREYEKLYKIKNSSRKEEISQTMDAVNLASRIGRFEDMKRFIKCLPTTSKGSLSFEKSLLIAFANYTRFMNFGFLTGDARLQLDKLVGAFSTDAIMSPQFNYLQGHYFQALKIYNECEDSWGVIARDFLKKRKSLPIAQYELEGYLYWIDTLINNSKYEQAAEEIERLSKIFSEFIPLNRYYVVWGIYLDGKLKHILGDSEKGATKLTEAMKILEEEHEEISILYLSVVKELGLAQMAAAMPEEAVKSFSKYRNIMTTIFGKESIAEWDACNYCLDAMYAAGQLDEFGKLFNQIETFKSYNNRESVLDFFQMLHTYKAGAIYHLQNNLYAPSVALIFEEMVKNMREGDFQDLLELRSCLNYAGYAQIIAEKPEEAIKHFSEQLEIDRKYAREVFSFLPQNLRSAYWGKNRMQMNRFFALNRTGSVTLDGGRVTALTTEQEYDKIGELLYDGALFNKGIMLQATVSLQRILASSGDDNLLKLNEELTGLRHMQSSRQLSPEQTKRAEELERQLMKGSKRYGDFMNFANIRWQDIRDKLKNNEVAVEFICSSDKGVTYYSAEVIRKDFNYPKHIFLFGCKEGENIFDRPDIYTSNFINLKIWKRILKHVNPGETIYFSPDGMLYGVAIENAKCGGDERIGSVYNMVRLSSTREIVVDHAPSNAKDVVLFGGLDYDIEGEDMKMLAQSTGFRGGDKTLSARIAWGYLPGTYEEVEAIYTGLKQDGNKDVRIYTGIEGTEECLKNASGSSIKILHIATHGYSLAQSDSNSLSNSDYVSADKSMSNNALVMSGGNNGWLFPDLIPEGVDDGLLTAQEIASLDFSDTGLVVLSACQTGLGQSSYEGVYGLQRAFKLAGAKTIVMSLAEVHDDATRLLMTQFHKHLEEGLTKRVAFAKAQEDVKNKSFIVDGEEISGMDPRFWASFVILD